MKKLRSLFASTLMLATMLGTAPLPLAANSFVYIGTYTEGSASEGIYLFRMDDETGQLTAAGIAGISTNLSFLAPNPKRNLLFAGGETRDFRTARTGPVAASEIGPETGELSEINRVPSSGQSPCHLVAVSDFDDFNPS